MSTITATPAAAKSRKQLYILGALAGVLLLILVIMVPKVLGGEPEAAPASSTDALPASTQGAAVAPSGVATVSANQRTVLAGISIAQSLPTKPGEGQLAGFDLFLPHDPFVQVVKETSATAGSQDGEPVGVKASGGSAAVGSPGAAGSPGTPGMPGSSISVGNPGTVGSSSGTGSTGSGLMSATIWVNGTEEAVGVKTKFPKEDPTFVLKSLKSNVAQIAVVGGAFKGGGGTIALKMGQTLTLVNTATGARYTLKLLYTGSAPEQVQQFTSAEK